MASGAGATRDTRVNDLDHVMERALEAGVKCRAALAVTLYTRAENLATQLHPDDTCLVPAWLRYCRARLQAKENRLLRKIVCRCR